MRSPTEPARSRVARGFREIFDVPKFLDGPEKSGPLRRIANTARAVSGLQREADDPSGELIHDRPSPRAALQAQRCADALAQAHRPQHLQRRPIEPSERNVADILEILAANGRGVETACG